MTPDKNTVKLAIVGCGYFVRKWHIPILKKNPKFSFQATMDINEQSAKETAMEAGARYGTADLDRILSDKEVDCVFITTRHDSHASIAVKAANAGKHVFCEKPMGLNRAECKAVAVTVKKNRVKYTVGYNRGMAPLVTRARELLKTIPSKKMIYHRIQGYLPETHWTHDPAVGGGRFVGEGCHIFDLLCELVSSPPVLVYASGGTFLDPAKVRIADSGIVTITFADGSVGTTLIASAGCNAFPKEATEIYCAQRGIFINDFKEMNHFGFEGQEMVRVALETGDKGQAAELQQVADAILNDKEPPNGIVNATRAAVISFMVSESIKKHAPVGISEKDYIF
jgi:predicted dehydrogenase